MKNSITQKARYTRTVQGLYYAMKRIGIYNKTPSKAKKRKLYQYLRQHIQEKE